MRVLLKSDGKTVLFLNGADTLNTNDDMWQTLDVEVETPLVDGKESLWVTFQNVADPLLRTNEIMLEKCENGHYCKLIPDNVIVVPGDWTFQLFSRTYDVVAEMWAGRVGADICPFTVEDGLPISNGNRVNTATIGALYAAATQKINAESKNAENISTLQTGLQTTDANVAKKVDKTTVDAALATVNEKITTVESIAKGVNQAKSYDNYQKMIEELNALDVGAFHIGQSILIRTLDVPDLWVSSVYNPSSEGIQYEYTTDEDFVAELKANGQVLVGYHYLAPLETGKVDLTDYVTSEEFEAVETSVGAAEGQIEGLRLTVNDLETRMDIADADLKESIAEVESIAKGAQQAESFADYQKMITRLNNISIEDIDTGNSYRGGQSIYIVTTNVPDLWIVAITVPGNNYTYVDDETFVNELKTNGTVQVGYFVLGALETHKVDLLGITGGTKLYLHKFPIVYDAYNTRQARYLSFISTSSEKQIVDYMETGLYTLNNMWVGWCIQFWSSDGTTLYGGKDWLKHITYGEFYLYEDPSDTAGTPCDIVFASLTDENYTVTEL